MSVLDSKSRIFCLLTVLFCVIQVTANLIFRKFVDLDFAGMLNVEISVGLFLFPIAFLILNSITEFFKKEAAMFAIRLGLVTSFLVLLIIQFTLALPAAKWSPVNDAMYQSVFGVFGIAVLVSSFGAYIGQFVGVAAFVSIKKITGEKSLWIRTSISLALSQLVDTIINIALFTSLMVIPRAEMIDVFISTYIFKLLASLCIIPFMYLLSKMIKAQLKEWA